MPRRRTLTNAEFIVPIPELDVSRDEHDFHELIYVVEGRYGVRIDDNTWHAGVGDVLFYPAHTVHEPVHHQAWATRLIVLQYTGDDPTDRPLHVTDHHGRIGLLAHWLIEQFQITPRPRTALSRMLELIRLELTTLAGSEPDDPIDRAILAMKRNLKGVHSVARFARIAGMSPSRFAHAFTDQVGESPMAFHRRQRIERALHLLRATDEPINEIAEQTGFTTAAHFSTVIREHTGMPPSTYRQR